MITQIQLHPLDFGIKNEHRPLADDHKVFQSLLGMMQNVDMISLRIHDWLQFVTECADSAMCSVLEFCQKYPRNFKCDRQGQLEGIGMSGDQMVGHFNLSMIPDTVKSTILNHNKLSSIGQWSGLKDEDEDDDDNEAEEMKEEDDGIGISIAERSGIRYRWTVISAMMQACKRC